MITHHYPSSIITYHVYLSFIAVYHYQYHYQYDYHYHYKCEHRSLPIIINLLWIAYNIYHHYLLSIIIRHYIY